MSSIPYEQAVYGSFPFWDRGYDLMARSPGCRPEWLEDFQRVCQRFGEPPRGATAARAIFVLRLESGPWLVAGVSSPGADDHGRPGALAFHGLFLSPRAYRRAGSNPFALEDALRSHWSSPVEALPSGRLKVSPEAPEARTERSRGGRWAAPDETAPADRSAEARQVAAALARGHRVAIESSEPIDALAREVWERLTPRQRARRSVATLTYRLDGLFDLAAVPRLAGVEPGVGYRTPSELANAAQRPARRATPRASLMVAALGTIAVLVGALARFGGNAAPTRPSQDVTPPTIPAERPSDLAPPDRDRFDTTTIGSDERDRVTEGMLDLANRFGVAVSPSGDPAACAKLMIDLAKAYRYSGPWLTAQELVQLETRSLSDPDAARALAWHEHLRHFQPDRPLPPDFAAGPLPWQLATLAWSFRVEPHPGLTPAELPFTLADALATPWPVQPSPLEAEHPALASYARFLRALPRR